MASSMLFMRNKNTTKDHSTKKLFIMRKNESHMAIMKIWWFQLSPKQLPMDPTHHKNEVDIVVLVTRIVGDHMSKIKNGPSM